MRDEKVARETLRTHERGGGGGQEMEPRESEVKECSFVLEMRDGAKRGGIRAEGSGYCGSNSLETSQLDRYPGNQQADSAPHARIHGEDRGREEGERRKRGGEEKGSMQAGCRPCVSSCVHRCDTSAGPLERDFRVVLEKRHLDFTP